MIINPIKALLIEDDPGDAFYIQELFADKNESTSTVTFVHVDTLNEGLTQLAQDAFDVVLLDLTLPDSQGSETFERVYSSYSHTPIVILTGLDDKETALSMMHKGAQDYLMKGHIDRDLLERPIRYAIERHQLIKSLEEQRNEVASREKYYRSLMNRLHEDVIVIDRDYIITDINNTFLHSTGEERSHIIGKKCFSVLQGLRSPCDEHGKNCLLKQVFENGEAANFTNQLTKRNGETIWVDIILSPLLNDNGHVTHVIETVRDITDILNTRQELSQTEQKYYQLLNSLSEGVWVIDKQGYTDFVTPRMAELLGYKPDEILKKHVFDFIPPEDISLCQEYLKRREKGIQEVHDFVFVRKDGSKINALVATTPIIDENGQYNGAIAGILDITERKMAERKLQQSEALHQSLVENLPLFVFRKDVEGRFTFMNSNMCQSLGKPQKDILGKTDYDFYPAELADKYHKDDLQVIQTGRVIELEETNKSFDGTEIQVNVVKSPIFDANDRVIGIQGISWDITEKKKLQEQLLQSQKMEAIGKLAGGVAHDFNNILMVIKSYSDFAFNQLPDHSNMRNDIQEIKNAGERASALTRQLLAFSRRQVVQPEAVHLKDILENMDKMLRRLIGEDIHFKTQCDPDVGLIKIDPGQIEQIIMNIVVNARDAMPNGGELTIEIHNANFHRPYHNHLNTIPPGDYVLLEIRDTGVGIDEESQQKIFDPFYTTKKTGKGTGLGLSTVYGIVQQNNGYISLKSSRGQETTFSIYFPLLSAQKRTEKKTEEKIKSAKGTETILVVEDDESARSVIEVGLTKYGYHILTAQNGEEAIQLFKQNQAAIDLILTDVIMPKIGGRQVAEEILSIDASTRIIYMSGYTDDEIIRQGILDQEIPFIQKPFDIQTLTKKIRSQLDRENQ
ncbi:PAS domain S-box protein [bacterium]|nr:PAS domain S-box protein [bacterium]